MSGRCSELSYSLLLKKLHKHKLYYQVNQNQKGGMHIQGKFIITLILLAGLCSPSFGQTTAEDWYNMGVSLNSQGLYDDAIQAYNKAIEINPQYATAWYNKAVILILYQNKTDEGMEVAKTAVELNPALSLFSSGNVLSNQGMYNESIQMYDRAIELDPEFAWPWNNKGVALSKIEKYEDAITAYDKAIELDPSYVDAWGNKGAALVVQGKYDEAIDCYDEAINLDSNYTKAWSGKGTALAIQGKYDEAIEYLDEAINLDPNSAPVWKFKGTVLQALGRTTEANDAFAKAEELGLTS